MSRFKALGSSVYEKGDRIGCTPDEAAIELARKLNAYQMRVERLKAEVERLTKAGDDMAADLPPFGSVIRWNAAKEGKQP